MKTLWFTALILMAWTAQGQFEQRKNAFSASYSLEGQGYYKAAIDTLLSADPTDHYSSQLRLGWLYYLAGEYPTAVYHYEQAATLMPYAVEPLLGAAYPYWAMGQYVKAEAQLQKVLAKHPGNTTALYRLAQLAYDQQDYDKAQKWLEDVINLYPFDGNSLTLNGWIYFQKGQLDKAKIMFQNALLYDPTSTSAQQGLSTIR